MKPYETLRSLRNEMFPPVLERAKGKDHWCYRHGMSKTRLYHVWGGMMTRCYNKTDPNYQNYGAKGVSMCDEWREDFMNFWKDMEDGYKKGLSIDRIDNSRGYSKDNCRWATILEQQRNKTTVKLYEYQNESLPIRVISKRLGLSATTLVRRMERGMTYEESIKVPKKKYIGATYDKNRKKWIVNIKRNKKQHYVGRFDTKVEALIVRKEWLNNHKPH